MGLTEKSLCMLTVCVQRKQRMYENCGASSIVSLRFYQSVCTRYTVETLQSCTVLRLSVQADHCRLRDMLSVDSIYPDYGRTDDL